MRHLRKRLQFSLSVDQNCRKTINILRRHIKASSDLLADCMQVASVCEQLREIPELKGGYNAVGFSQGELYKSQAQLMCPSSGTAT